MARPSNSELLSLKEQLEQRMKEADSLVENLRKHQSYLETKLSACEGFFAAITGAVEQVASTNESATSELKSITAAKDKALEDSNVVSELAKNANEISTNVSGIRDQLARIIEKSKHQQRFIETLLPGATSAGLASAFRERKEAFQQPKKLWAVAFVVSMGFLLTIAFVGRPSVTTLESEFLHVLGRLPFAIPVVWLAIYAGRRHGQALRLEEDYAHKEAMSKSFEGYKKQLMEIEENYENKASTVELINRTLEALSLHPGRIYQGKHEDISPLSSISTLMRNKGEDGAGL